MKNNQPNKGEMPLSMPPELEQQFTQYCNGDLTASQGQSTVKAIARSIGRIDFTSLGDDSWMVWS